MSELRAIRAQQPELQAAVDLHIELLSLQRRLQGRVPLPWIDVTAEALARHQVGGLPLLRFEDIPLDLSDLRLVVRQTADLLRRFGAIDDADHQQVQTLGRDIKLLAVAGTWYRGAFDRQVAPAGPTPADRAEPAGLTDTVDQVLSLAMRPFLSRCAEVLQPRPELAIWTHPHCALCAGMPDFSVITPAAERHLICARCELRWKWEPLACPYCRNSDRARITSFATSDGRYRVYACDACQRYLKAYDARRTNRPVMPMVDTVATLPLDAAAMQRGYRS